MIRKLAMHDPTMAEKVFSLQREAYLREAALIGTEEIPPLQESPEMLMNSGEQFFGYFSGEELCGVVAFRKDGDCVDICRLFVKPERFRQGIGRKLLEFVGGIRGIRRAVVCTGAANLPALRFYQKNGFHPVETLRKGPVLLTRLEKRWEPERPH
jgi:Acetyltransferase (GNAT) family.